jgi:hypothetical protein
VPNKRRLGPWSEEATSWGAVLCVETSSVGRVGAPERLAPRPCACYTIAHGRARISKNACSQDASAG